MIKLGKSKSANYTISGVFSGKKKHKEVIEKLYYVSPFPTEKTAYMYLGKKRDFSICKLKKSIEKIVSGNERGWNIDVPTFTNELVSTSDVVKICVEKEIYLKKEIWNLKTGANKHKSSKGIVLLNAEKEAKVFSETKLLAEGINFARSLQAKSPNVLTSVVLAKEIQGFLSSEKNLSIKVLTKPEIIANKMGLLLAVNSGSNYDARVVVIEYKGDPSSKAKQALVGKGITFDAGGYNIKVAKHMIGMKHDMSATAIISAAMKSIAKAKPKTNVVAVLCLTDNMVSKTSTVPDSVVVSMNGLSVEINNTDAEGRLVLADGITYAIRKCQATRILDMSTLTGAITVALGKTYSGVWATCENDYKQIKCASKKAMENIWRMPFHSDFLKYMKKTPVADLRNTDYTGLGGSNAAAMFLKEFTEKLPYIHLDIAGTANIDDTPTGCLVKTIYQFIINK